MSFHTAILLILGVGQFAFLAGALYGRHYEHKDLERRGRIRDM
jgi:hypothetical protein